MVVGWEAGWLANHRLSEVPGRTCTLRFEDRLRYQTGDPVGGPVRGC